jgi:hypothetical protein
MAQRGNTWSVPAGQTETFTVAITGGAGNAIAGQYQGDEPLPVVVWEGSDLTPIAGVVSAAWQSGPSGLVQVDVSPPSTMTPGYYRCRLSVTYNGNTGPFYFGWIKVEAIPGTASEPPTYGALQDLIDRAGEWLTRLMQSGSGDVTNFVRERATAREWLDDVITGNSRVFAYRFDLTYALYYGSFPFGPVEAPDSVIAGYLASDYLQVVPRTIECVSYKALAFVCEKRQTFDEAGEQYRQRAQWYHRKASNSLRRYRPTLDTNGDGIADIAFNLGVITFR